MSLFDDENGRVSGGEESQNRENFYYTGGMPPPVSPLSQGGYPWRRYLARSIDTGIYGTIWAAVAGHFFKMMMLDRADFWSILDLVVVIVMMLLLEPLFISLFGTTPGKVIFGIRITAPDGKRLTYSEALDRTWGLFTKGMGYNIPIYSLVCSWRCYKVCKQGDTMPWDEEISFSVKDTRGWRTFAFVLAFVALVALDVTVAMMQYLPPNRGEITIEEFAENYNYYARFFGVDIDGYALDAKGRWFELPTREEHFNLNADFIPELEFELENGYVQSVSFFYEIEDQNEFIGGFESKLLVLSLSFICAQKEMRSFSNAFVNIAEVFDRVGVRLNLVPPDFDFIEAGVRVNCDTEASGYDIFMDSSLVSAEGTYFSMDFSMTK